MHILVGHRAFQIERAKPSRRGDPEERGGGGGRGGDIYYGKSFQFITSEKRKERRLSLPPSLVEDTLHTFGWCLKGPGGSNRICSGSSPHLGLHAYILSGEGLRGMGSGDMRTRQVCPNFSRTHMHQDVIEAKKKENRQHPKTVWTVQHRAWPCGETCRRSGGPRRQ